MKTAKEIQRKIDYLLLELSCNPDNIKIRASAINKIAHFKILKLALENGLYTEEKLNNQIESLKSLTVKMDDDLLRMSSKEKRNEYKAETDYKKYKLQLETLIYLQS
jgi:hypothetical protein